MKINLIKMINYFLILIKKNKAINCNNLFIEQNK